MSVDIAAGAGLLPTASFPYAPWSDATVNKIVTTADPSNPRRDIVVAYLDTSVPSTAVTNSVGALKFMVVAGTPGASPTDPNSGTIQAAVGVGYPWVYLARIRVGVPGAYVAPTSVVDGMIDDLRQSISFKGRLWGGASNTVGHLVPNVADGTVVVSTDQGTVGSALLSTSAITLGFASITSNFALTTSETTPTQVTGLTAAVTIPAGSRKVEISAFCSSVTLAAGVGVLTIWDGTVGSGTQIGQGNIASSLGLGFVSAVVTPAAGAKTYNIGISNSGLNDTTVGAAATQPAYILVKAI